MFSFILLLVLYGAICASDIPEKNDVDQRELFVCHSSEIKCNHNCKKVSSNHCFTSILVHKGTSLATFIVGQNVSVNFSEITFQHIGQNCALSLKLSHSFLLHCNLFLQENTNAPDLSLLESSLSIRNISLTPINKKMEIPPLASVLPSFDSTSCSSLELSHSSFSSFPMLSCPFLSAPLLSFVHVWDSSFANITANFSKYQSQHNPEKQSSILCSCYFHTVDNVFDGGIAQSINDPSHSLISCNNTLISCFRSANDNYTNNKQMDHIKIKEGDHLFKDCEWHSSGSDYTGGAISFENQLTSSIVIDCCVFENCFSFDKGGTLYTVNIKKQVIKNSRIENSTSCYGGGIFCGQIASAISFFNISNCKCNATTGVGGGMSWRYAGKHVTLDNDSLSFGAMLFNYSFNGCDSICTYGGGLSIYEPINEYPVLRECLYQKCNSRQYGGGLYYNVHQLTPENATLLFYCLFVNNVSPNGDDIYFGDGYFRLQANPLCGCASQTKSSTRLVIYTDQLRQHSEWLETHAGIYTDGTKGNNRSASCGVSEGNPCRTIAYSFAMLLRYNSSSIILLNSTFDSEPDTINVGTSTRQITGIGREEVMLSSAHLPSAHPLFAVSTGSLTAANFTIVHAPSSGSSVLFFLSSTGTMTLDSISVKRSTADALVLFQAALLCCRNGGVATICNTNMANFSFSGCPAILCDHSSMTCANCSLSSMKSERDSGAGINISVGAQNSFVSNNTTLVGCECSKGNGGGISIVHQSGGRIRVEGLAGFATFSACTVPKDEASKGKGGGIFIHTKEYICDACLSKVSFAGCDGWKGKCVFYDAVELSAVVKNTTFDFNMDEMNDDDLMGFEADFRAQPVPLKAYLLQEDGCGCVGGLNKRDFKGCGSSVYPCETISWVVNLKFPSQKREIQLHDSFRWTEHITMDQREWDVRCIERGGKINVDLSQNQKAVSMIETKNLVSISNMSFFAASSIEGIIECLMLCTDSILTVTNCSLKMESGSIGTSFAEVAKGKLFLVSFEIASESISTSHLIIVSGSNSKAFVQCSEFKELRGTESNALIYVCMGGTVEMENNTMTSCEMKNSAIVENEEGNILLASNVTFSAIERTEGDGSCIHCSCVDGQASASTIKKCLFENCSVKETNSGGGALKCDLGVGAILLVEECQFGNCSAPSSDTVGYGGGTYLDLHEADIAFKILAPLFSTSLPNSAYYGDDVFVQSPNLTTSITNETMPFAHSSGTEKVNSLQGFDGENRVNAIPLIYFICDAGSTVHADSSKGLNVAPCGFTDYPCQTLSYSFSKQMTKAKDVSLSVSFELREELVLSDQYGIHISGVGSCSLFIVHESNSSQPGVITMSENCPTAVMAFIRFRLPDKLQTHSSFACQNSQGELVLQDSIFETQDESPPLSYNLISALSGTLTISTVAAANIPLRDASFLVATGFASVHMKSASLVEVETTSQHGLISLSSQNASLFIDDSTLLSQHASQDFTLIFSDNANAIDVSNTSMKGFANNMKNGSAICCTVNDQQRLRIEGGTFESCRADGGHGGGIYVRGNYGGKVTIGNATNAPTMFAKCTSTEIGSSGGLGGGIYLHMTDSSAGVIMSSISFAECNATRGGSCVFVEAINLSSAITSESLNFEFEKSSNSSFGELAGFEGGNTAFAIPLVLFLRNFTSPAFISNTGTDYRMCGYKDYPCQTINYAGTARYGSAKGKVRLAKEFEFSNRIAFTQQEMEIDAEDDSEKLTVRSDGLGEGSGLIEARVDVSFTGISFSIPLAFTISRNCLLLCSGSVLTVADCITEAISSGVSYSIACCTNGKLVLNNFTVLNIEFATAAAIKVSGREAEAELICLSIDGAKTDEVSGLIVANNGGVIGLEESLINCTTTIFMNHSMLFVGESSSLTATNSSFTGAARRNGNGGAISGTICDEAACTVSGCNFSSNACIDGHSKGGSMIVNVRKGGKLLFDSNKVTNSKVDAENGFGGGLHLSFEDLEVNYSMIAISFSGNQARLGSDVFLICPSPRIMIDKNKWAGSAQPGDANLKTMWVIDDESYPSINVSMLKYLFVSNDEIVFVDREESSNNAGCGNSNNPCQELAFGFSQMSSIKTTLSILKSADLSQPIHCEDDPLTICGIEEINSALKVMNNGRITLLKGSQATYLSVSSLNITLQTTAEQLLHDVFIEAAVGKVYFVSCIFGDPDGVEKRCCVWIVKGNGSSISFGNVLVAKLLFQSSCGLASINSGSLVIDKSTVDTVSTSSDSLIVCINEASSRINNTNITTYKTAKGSFHKVSGSGSNVISGHCMLSGCSSANGNGGAVSFPFYNSEGIEIVDIKGSDRTHFSDSVDLAMFLYQKQATSIYVSKTGYDMIGCGAEEYPCFSFKRGATNLNEQSFEKEILIGTETYIQEPVDVSSFLISSSTSSKASILFKPEIIGNSRNAILEATHQLAVILISFHIPSAFSSNVDCLIFASDTQLRIANSSFIQNGTDPLLFALIRTSGGSVEVNSCNISAITARFTPFAISGNLYLADAQLSQLKVPESLRGGALDVCLSEDNAVSLKTSDLSFCECSRNEGKGGFLYLDCTLSAASQPLKIDAITVSSNMAHIGKNIFWKAKI
ncbi:uncharacterized protein MONOS_17025 [Monocercomonoides exilis]|uniref:uncharacterized protein n=1 Tax=Monocercomonoides exilis TaxID=2049356 RepID=UPI00355A6998|nr:hypothetical protein MONOS_17025 [Monocercomonoides exilis]